MGLDMYLNKRTYIKNWEHTPKSERHNITITKGGAIVSIDKDKISYIVEEVAYWRKANQIHNWFVNYVQGGEDDCKEYSVSIEELKILLVEINEVLDNPNRAKEILPTAKGFFFGNYDYDNYYLENLKYTKVILETIFNNNNSSDVDYTYQSSW